MAKYKVILLSERGNVPPLGLGCLKTYVESDKRLSGKVSVSIEYLDSFDSPGRVAGLRPDLVGVSSYGDAKGGLDKVFRACASLKALDGKLKTVMGGPGVDLRTPEELFESGAVDYFVRGEGEATFAELLLHLTGGKPALEDIPGLAFRHEGAPVFNPPRRPMKDPGRVPSPYLEGVFDLSGFSEFFVEGSRGCASACRYCPSGATGLRYFSSRRLLEEVRAILAGAPQALCISPADADFFLDAGRAKRLLREFKRLSGERRAKFLFTTNPRVWDEEVMTALSCDKFRVSIGVQSTNPEALDCANRRYSAERLKRDVKRFQALALHARFSMDLITGLPGDGLRGYMETLDWAVSTGADLMIYRLMLFPGTRFTLQKERYGVVCEKRYPYRVLSTATFPRADMRRAARLSDRCGFIFRHLGLDRYLTSAILFLGKALRGRVRLSFLLVCVELAAFMRGNARFRGLIRDWENCDQGNYLGGENLLYRAELLGLVLGFSKKLLSRHGRGGRFRGLSAALGAARGRLFFKHYAAGRQQAFRDFIASLPGKPGRSLLLCLEDSSDHCHMRCDDVLFLRDYFTDESYGHRERAALREPVPVPDLERVLPGVARGRRGKYGLIVLSGVYGLLPPEKRKAVLGKLRDLAGENGRLLVFDDLLGPPDPDRAGGRMSEDRAARELGSAGWRGVRRSAIPYGPEAAAAKAPPVWFFRCVNGWRGDMEAGLCDNSQGTHSNILTI